MVSRQGDLFVLLVRLKRGPPARAPPEGRAGGGSETCSEHTGSPFSPSSFVLLPSFVISFRVSQHAALWGIPGVGCSTQTASDSELQTEISKSCCCALILNQRLSSPGFCLPPSLHLGVDKTLEARAEVAETSGAFTPCSPPLPSSIAPWEGPLAVAFPDGRHPSLATGSLAHQSVASAGGSAVEMFFTWGAVTSRVTVSATAALSAVPPHPSPPRFRVPGETGSRWKAAVGEVQGNGCELGVSSAAKFAATCTVVLSRVSGGGSTTK